MPEDVSMRSGGDEGLIGIFVNEATECLESLGHALNHAQDAPPDDPHAQYIVAHTLRGAAALYGFTAVAGLAEILEEIFERPPQRLFPEWPQLLPALHALLDALHDQIDGIAKHGHEDGAAAAQWHERFPGVLGAVPTADVSSEGPVEFAEPAETYLIPRLEPDVLTYFAPEAQEYLEALETSVLKLEQDPANGEVIQQLFRTAHTLKGSAYTVGFKAVGDVTHHVESIMGAIRDGRMTAAAGVTEAIFRTVDVVRMLMRLDAGGLDRLKAEFTGVMRLLIRLEQQTVSEEPGRRQEPRVEQKPILAAVAPRVDGPPPREKAQPSHGRSRPADEGSVIRVSRDRLERLMNLVGELVTSRGRLEQRLVNLEQLSQQVLACRTRMHETVRTFEERHAFTIPAPSLGTSSTPSVGGAPPAFSTFPGLQDLGSLEFDKYDDFNILARRIAEVSADVTEAMNQLNASIRKARDDMGQLQQLTLGMRDEIARARMVPVGTPFTRFQRAIREMAKASAKEVALQISGEQTEVDTGVVERLVDPLIHLVRNAVYHGIEPPAVRAARGKPPTGTIYLHAAHRGSALIIEVEDDGAGLNLDKIKAKAVGVGLLRAEAAPSLSEAETIKLIFLPGFSTAEDVGEQAGRGVGLDVVKRALEVMNGQIDVETEPGVGTKFTLRLPLTLLISTALLVRVSGARYAIPLPSIREVIVPPAGAIQEVGGRSILQVEDEAIDVRSLARLLGLPANPQAAPRPIVVVRTATGVQGVEVDELLGRQEIVIKSLGPLRPFQESYFAGATIDPDGSVVLVLDFGRLLAVPKKREALPAPEVEAAEPAAAPPAATFEDRWRILLIDDSLSVRKFVGKMLESAGYDVETAVDGEEGLRKAASANYRLIITDLEMPKLNGYEVIQALRERPHTATVPILVMTTRAGEKHRQMALSIGASGYVAKPVEERSFIHEVGLWTGRIAKVAT